MKKLMLAALLSLVLAACLEAAEVTVTQIKASGSGGQVTIDPRLSDLADKISRQFRFSRYDFLSRSATRVNVGGTSTSQLATGDYLALTLNAAEQTTDGNGDSYVLYTLNIEVYSKTQSGKKSIFRTSLKSPQGTTFLIVPGNFESIGGYLILAIRTD